MRFRSIWVTSFQNSLRNPDPCDFMTHCPLSYSPGRSGVRVGGWFHGRSVVARKKV